MAWFQPGNELKSNENQTSTLGQVKKPKICIALPHTGSMASEFTEKTWKALTMIAVPWADKLVFQCKVPSLPLARNILVREFLKTDAEYILWLDSDMLPEAPGDANEALKILLDTLVSTGESIVSGLYRAKQVHGFNYAIWKDADPKQLAPGMEFGYQHVTDWTGDWIEIAVCGLGFCLMHRRVFEKLNQPYFSWEIPDTQSEDFDMLSKARKAGFKVWCRTSVRLSHMGGLVLSSDGKIRVPMV